MDEMVNLTGIQQLTQGIADQISTAINVDAVRKRLTNENALINWYFPRPVNQRGAKGTVVNKGYFIDRWKLVDGEVTLTDDGLLLNGTIQQILEFPIKYPTTSSVLTTDGILEDGVEYDDDLHTFQVSGNGEILIAAKLELGNKQTLAEEINGKFILKDLPDYYHELNKCLLFYRTVDSCYPGNTSGGNASAQIFMNGLNMRAKPSNHLGYMFLFGVKSFVTQDGLQVKGSTLYQQKSGDIFGEFSIPNLSYPSSAGTVITMRFNGYLDAEL